MIIRILGEGQYELPDDSVADLNVLDDALQAAIEDGAADRFRTTLTALLAAVRERGRPVPDDVLTASDLVLPASDSDLSEVAALLGDEGLIPG